MQERIQNQIKGNRIDLMWQLTYYKRTYEKTNQREATRLCKPLQNHTYIWDLLNYYKTYRIIFAHSCDPCTFYSIFALLSFENLIAVNLVVFTVFSFICALFGLHQSLNRVLNEIKYKITSLFSALPFIYDCIFQQS